MQGKTQKMSDSESAEKPTVLTEDETDAAEFSIVVKQEVSLTFHLWMVCLYLIW